MNAKDLLILHGEKLAVGVTGLLCGWVVYSALTDESIRPKDGKTPKDIKDDIAFIDQYRNKQQAPILTPVPDYPGRMQLNFKREIPATPTIAALMRHPDLTPNGPVEGFLYAFELLPATIELEDKVGAITVTVRVPDGGRAANDRLSAGAGANWSRDIGRSSKQDNFAEVLGALVERKVGRDPKAEWQPLNGGRPVDIGTPLVLEDIVDYELYEFRARLVAKATGWTGAPGGGTVMVAEGRWLDGKGDPLPEPDQAWWGRLSTLIGKQPDPSLQRKLLKPADELKAFFTLEPKEQVYKGPLPEAATGLRALSPIRFQLQKLTPDAKNEGQFIATFLLTKLVREGGKEGWLAMQKFNVPVGGMVGQKDVAIVPPKELGQGDKLRKWSLETPFKLEKLQSDLKRTIYYELKPEARKDGQKGKALALRQKDVDTDVATLVNTRTGEKIQLIKLGRLTRPSDPKAMITPDLKPADEQQEFEKDPYSFVSSPLEPAKPIQHAPGTGPLEELRKQGDNLAVTDVEYWEMPDGRLYYWEPLNQEIMKRWKPGVEPKAEPEKPAPRPADPKPEAVPAPAGAPTPAGEPTPPTMPQDANVPLGVLPPPKDAR